MLGLLPACPLLGQTEFGSVQVAPIEANSKQAGLAYGWNRPAALSSSEFGGGPSGIGKRSLWDWIPDPSSIRHDDPNDPARHVGLGHPLVGTSWRNRPFHVGWFFGAMFGDQLIDGRVDQDTGIFGGYRLGWDFDHYWGTEARLGFSNLDLTDTTPLPNIDIRTSRNQFVDLNLMYYPWGDARWRPYVSLGLGAGDFYFQDESLRSIRETVVAFPLSVGFKYYRHNWLSWRVDVTDYWTLGAGELDSMHNLALTAGVEVHFGGTRVGYFPERASRYLW